MSLEFVRATVAEVTPAARDQVLLVLEDPADLLRHHERAGQYCVIRPLGGPEGYFALVSTPKERALRFLIKASGEPSETLSKLAPGDEVEVTAPAGPGFDLARAHGREVVFVATGTGIAPIRAALETVLTHRADFGDLWLYYGVRDPSFTALGADLEQWKKRGVHVRVQYSRPEANGEQNGYVQELLVDERPDLRGVALIAAGQEEMLEGLAAHMDELGSGREWILQNI